MKMILTLLGVVLLVVAGVYFLIPADQLLEARIAPVATPSRTRWPWTAVAHALCWALGTTHLPTRFAARFAGGEQRDDRPQQNGRLRVPQHDRGHDGGDQDRRPLQVAAEGQDVVRGRGQPLGRHHEPDRQPEQGRDQRRREDPVRGEGTRGLVDQLLSGTRGVQGHCGDPTICA